MPRRGFLWLPALLSCHLHTKALLPWATLRFSADSSTDMFRDFHFRDLLDNLLTSSDAFIDAGSNVMKALWRSTPNG